MTIALLDAFCQITNGAWREGDWKSKLWDVQMRLPQDRPSHKNVAYS
jgi:hypothetical protein